MPWKDHQAKLRLTDSWILFFLSSFLSNSDIIAMINLVNGKNINNIYFAGSEVYYLMGCIWFLRTRCWILSYRIDRLHVRNGKSTESHFVRLNPVYLSSLLWVFSICCHLVLWPKVICTDQLFWQYRVMFHAPINAACWENTEKHEWVSRSVSLRKYEWVSF